MTGAAGGDDSWPKATNSRVSTVDSGPRWAIVRLDKIPYFLDSHHVGTFEGILRFAGVKGSVRLASRSPMSADLLVAWDP